MAVLKNGGSQQYTTESGHTFTITRVAKNGYQLTYPDGKPGNATYATIGEARNDAEGLSHIWATMEAEKLPELTDNARKNLRYMAQTGIKFWVLRAQRYGVTA